VSGDVGIVDFEADVLTAHRAEAAARVFMSRLPVVAAAEAEVSGMLLAIDGFEILAQRIELVWAEFEVLSAHPEGRITTHHGSFLDLRSNRKEATKHQSAGAFHQESPADISLIPLFKDVCQTAKQVLFPDLLAVEIVA
jgi:hypothetical protein